MSGVNKVILLGRLGIDPEIRRFDNTGNMVANFRLATSEVYKDKEGKKVEQTEWHNVKLHNTLAGLAEKYLHKGDMVYIEGKLRTRAWDDKEGKKHYMTETIGLTMTFIPNGKGGNGTTSEKKEGVAYQEPVMETVVEESAEVFTPSSN